MPKVLFLTYYYAPCNAVAANRPNSFTRELAAQGYEVTVVTRHWQGNEKVWTDYLASDRRAAVVTRSPNVNVHYLPVKAFQYWPAALTPLQTVWQNIMGNFNYELPYTQFALYVTPLLQREKFDFILVSTPPLTALKVAARVARQFKVPLIVDVRDFENDILLYKKKRHSWFRQQQHNLLMRFFKQWVAPAKAICTASPPLTEYIQQATGKPAFTLNNGFNKALLDVNEPQHRDAFTITVTGTLYEMANLPVMLEACRLVAQRMPDAPIRFQFIGLLANAKVADMFRAVLPESKLLITHRISQDEAMAKASASHVLMLAGFDEMTGAYTTKIFEYLGLRRNILQIPGDRDVVEQLIAETRAGKAPHTAEEAFEVIRDWYMQWQNQGTVPYDGDMTKIMTYLREKQFEKLLEKMKA